MKLPTLPTLPPDKLGHFFWGAVASVAGLLVAYQAGVPAWAGALGAALVVGILKDVVIDRLLKRGQFDPMDIVSTVAGGVPAAIGAAGIAWGIS